ncbi:sugar transporter [Leptobacterium flavescens]|uniref:Sugar transporter n=1 Tax=Leptobacterium flavescens TaxID=472055 RepID=A0A6P0UIB0_9FLAO|nr:polysaccharide biosynthesis/export family protein [Leptobacterium flavescens]NER12190.1 sugar transporter [Leptobacterium flavescens]
MKFRSFFVLPFLLIFLQSCVSNKRLVYLQESEEINKENQASINALSKPYKIQVNDILYIDIKASDPELVAIFKTSEREGAAGVGNDPGTLYFEGYTVDIHGNIRIPILGELNVLGYTAEEIRKMIEKKLLENYLTESTNLFVTVKLAGLNYSVIGEVANPGSNVLYQERVNILEAIANAGDIPITGNREDVLIIRQYPDGKKIHHVDLTDKNLLQSPYFYILPNDMIYIKPLKQKSWGTGTTGFQTFTTVFSIVSIITSTVLLIQNL